MQALVELIVGFIALMASAALSHFGVDLHAASQSDREVRRVSDCGDSAPSAAVLISSAPKRDC